MIYKLFVLKDKKAGCFDSQILLFVNSDVAKRWLYQLLHDYMDSDAGRNSAIAAYPEDFELYCIGDFDSSSGEIHYSNPEFIISCLDVKEI